MKKTIILYFILLCIISCKNKEKDKTVTDTLDTISSKKLFTKDALKGKSYEELRILRNEIFAKKGYVFKDTVLNKYFSTKKWYKPDKEAQITLTDSEKKNIELIKTLEKELKPFELPEAYKVLDTISFDFDGDQVKDVIQLVKNTKSSYFEQFIFIYLSKTKKRQKIDLGLDDEFDQTYASINKENNIFQFEYTIPGTGLFNYEYNFKYNSKIKNFQLVSYSSSSRIMYGHISKAYYLFNGTYMVTKEASTIEEPNKMITTKNYGKQESKVITPDLVNGKLYAYLDNIGHEFYEEQYSDYYGEFIDCREAIIHKLALDFEYGALNYLGNYKVFKKELKNFVQNINIDALKRSKDDTYSKTYKLHRNWDLDYIEKDDCEDKLFLVFNVDTNTFRIQINNCLLVYEDNEVIHASEQSIMFEYNIEANCAYKFKRVQGAG